MVLWFQGSSFDHAYLRLSQSETVVGSLKLAVSAQVHKNTSAQEHDLHETAFVIE